MMPSRIEALWRRLGIPPIDRSRGFGADEAVLDIFGDLGSVSGVWITQATAAGHFQRKALSRWYGLPAFAFELCSIREV